LDIATDIISILEMRSLGYRKYTMIYLFGFFMSLAANFYTIYKDAKKREVLCRIENISIPYKILLKFTISINQESGFLNNKKIFSFLFFYFI
jgi:hypothetical protein